MMITQLPSQNPFNERMTEVLRGLGDVYTQQILKQRQVSELGRRLKAMGMPEEAAGLPPEALKEFVRQHMTRAGGGVADRLQLGLSATFPGGGFDRDFAANTQRSMSLQPGQMPMPIGQAPAVPGQMPTFAQPQQSLNFEDRERAIDDWARRSQMQVAAAPGMTAEQKNELYKRISDEKAQALSRIQEEQKTARTDIADHLKEMSKIRREAPSSIRRLEAAKKIAGKEEQPAVGSMRALRALMPDRIFRALESGDAQAYRQVLGREYLDFRESAGKGMSNITFQEFANAMPDMYQDPEQRDKMFDILILSHKAEEAEAKLTDRLLKQHGGRPSLLFKQELGEHMDRIRREVDRRVMALLGK